MKKLLGYRWYYIDDNTRIEYGFHFAEYAKSYRLQRKGGCGWYYTGAWSYPSIHQNDPIERVIEYLYWKEEQLKAKNKIHF